MEGIEILAGRVGYRSRWARRLKCIVRPYEVGWLLTPLGWKYQTASQLDSEDYCHLICFLMASCFSDLGCPYGEVNY